MVGAVAILVVMVLVGPVLVMMAGAIWSIVMGASHMDEARARDPEAMNEAA